MKGEKIMVKFFAVYDNPNGKREAWIYHNMEQYFKDTFCPDCKIIFTMDLSGVRGKSRKEKKENLRNMAIDFQSNLCEMPELSYGEWAEIDDFFSFYGKQYGLLKEFQSNGII